MVMQDDLANSDGNKNHGKRKVGSLFPFHLFVRTFVEFAICKTWKFQHCIQREG
jgi:hypothetical protein